MRMTDREMLLLAYGALKVSSQTAQNLRDVVVIIEEHLYPAQVVIQEADEIEMKPKTL